MNKGGRKVSLRDSLYLTDEPSESTFKYDNQLPNLPVPELEASVMKLLDTIKPIAKDQAIYEETVEKAKRFIQDNQAKELQELLKKRAVEQKNWLEEWWLEFAYLRSRKPLIPYSNMSGPLPVMQYWPLVNNTDPNFHQTRARRAGLSTFFQLSFWRMLRDEKMRPMIHKGVPWSMSQFRYLFNTVRLPGEPKDELRTCFKTKAEGGAPASTEIVIIYRGYIFALKVAQAILSRGDIHEVQLMTAPQIERQLNYIENWCSSKPHGPGVGALTTRERSEWAEARQKLANVSPRNAQLLDRIERALWVLVMDDNEPQAGDERLALSMCGDPRNRWADKSITSIVFKNGSFAASADHTPYDGFCTAILTHYLMTSVEECEGEWRDELASDVCASGIDNSQQPELLDFKLDIELNQLIEEACQQFATIVSTVDSLHRTFSHFGKAILKEHRFHPEAFVQCAIHAAYYRQHGKMAPAYVTASTRRFHNGRTETCRSCFPEMLDFVQFLCENASNPHTKKEAYRLLKLSVEKFQRLMEEATNGKGCDRHLMGLYLTAILEGRPIPELFEDELVQRNNNYVLSTSCSGYWNVVGGVPPLVEDGYGCFYGIEDQAITFCCLAYKTSLETDLKLFYGNLEKSLLEMFNILQQGTSKL